MTLANRFQVFFSAPEMLRFLWDLDTGLMKSKKSSDLDFWKFKISLCIDLMM